MKTLRLSPTSASSPSFALISVLALVSLAALTATAFLASARLERQATMPLSQNTKLEMALSAGAECAKEVITMPMRHFNHVTTYWRETGDRDWWTNELGYLLNGSAKETSVGTKTSTVINFACCFSTATFTNLGTDANELIVISNNITSQGAFSNEMSDFMRTQTNFLTGQSTNIPLLGDTPANRCTSPPVGWVYIRQDVRIKPGSTNTTNVPVARFAFFVQDLGGMIDAERMGDTTNGIPFRQSPVLPANYALGTNPADISLTNMTGTGLTNISTVSNLTTSNNRFKYLTPGMLVLSNAGNLATKDLRYFATGLRHWTNAYERIPMGLGYPRSWEIKTQLKDVNFTNTVYSAPSGSYPSAAIPTTNTNFILFISNNLTNFALRSGGMNTNRYLAALGAIAQDYVDIDSIPTVGGAGSTSFTGIEPLPFATETATSVYWYNHGLNIEPYVGQLADEIRVENFIELWNPSDRTFNGTINVLLLNNYSCGSVTWTNPVGSLSGGLDLTKQSSASRTVTNSLGNIVNGANPLSVNLAPNQYGVYSLGTNIHKFRIAATDVNPKYSSGPNFNSGANAKLSLERPNQAGQSIFDSKLQLSTGGKLYFQATNLMRQTRPLDCRLNNGIAAFGGSLPALRMTINAGLNSSPAMPGDPRIAFYLTCTNASTGYTWNPTPGATLGYRNYSVSSVDPPTVYDASPMLWMDGGHANSPQASVSVTANTVPTLGVKPATSDYVQKFNNTGAWSNIFELGNLFDPMAWDVPVSSPCLTTAHSAAGNSNNVLTNGGGTTLRIGRAEHQRFAWTKQGVVEIPNMQISSAALLDMFCVKNQPDQSGQINLNTASAPVLRALAGGIRLVNDPAQLPTISVNAPISAGMVEAFAQGVMRFRAKYPFYSPSQLAFIGTDPAWPDPTTWPKNAVFGNLNSISLVTNSVNTLTSTSLGITEWNDQAAEEWFAKIFKLSTTSSQNFRVYVIAQKATNQGNNLIGVGPVVRKYYNVLVRINTDDVDDVPSAGFSTLNLSEAPY